jgi:hypothetical protein
LTEEFSVDLEHLSTTKTYRPLFVTNICYFLVTNTFGWSAVVFCACQIIHIQFCLWCSRWLQLRSIWLQTCYKQRKTTAVIEPYVFDRIYVFPQSFLVSVKGLLPTLWRPTAFSWVMDITVCNMRLKIIHTYHAVPMPRPCRSAKDLDCVFPIWFPQCGRVWFTHTIPRPSRSESNSSRSTHGRGMGMAWHVWISIGRPETQVGDLSAFGFLRLPLELPRRLSEAYQYVKLYD